MEIFCKVSGSRCYRHVVLCTRVRQFTKVMCFRLVAGSDLFIGCKLYTAVAVQYKRYITSGKNNRMEHVKVRNEKNGKLRIEQTKPEIEMNKEECFKRDLRLILAPGIGNS